MDIFRVAYARQVPWPEYVLNERMIVHIPCCICKIGTLMFFRDPCTGSRYSRHLQPNVHSRPVHRVPVTPVSLKLIVTRASCIQGLCILYPRPLHPVSKASASCIQGPSIIRDPCILYPPRLLFHIQAACLGIRDPCSFS